LFASCGGGSGGNGDPDGRPGPDDGGAGDAAIGQVVQCDARWPAPQSGTCDGQSGSGSAVVLRGNILGDGTTYLDGEVAYEGDLITCVACDCSATSGYSTAAVISCGGAAISPGLVNAHDHLNYDNQPPLASTAAGGTRYNHRHDWRGGVSTPSNQFGTGAASAGMRWNELRHALSGTTSIAASTLASGMVRNLDELESADLARGLLPTIYEVFALGDSNETFRDSCGWNYEYSEYEVSLFPGMVTHTSEGINDYAHEEFRCQSRSSDGGRDFTERNVAHIHAIGLTTTDYFNMARDQAKLVWSPRSNISLYGNTADAPLFMRLGGVVSLGTDWTYSGSANLTREMACAAELGASAYGGALTAEDVWRMGTINGAIATGQAQWLGSLTVGKVADVAIFRADPGETHAATIGATTGEIALVVRDGDLLFAESEVATALGQSCDQVTVCGASHQVCSSREFGTTFQTIETEVSAGSNPAYPAVFCDVPANEPTCIPSRPGEYDGPSSSDPDGDGLTDGDNCPTVFNPVRPMDGGGQPDNDADGLGDACDPSPLTPDLDSDGAVNTVDNCPFDTNLDQADTDSDQKGNVCDACPDRSNPVSVCQPAPVGIVAIQDGTVGSGTAVNIEGVVVTAVDNSGFTAQDPTVSDGRHAGVYVFVGSPPGVAIGDVVSVGGTVTEYFDLTEITGASVLSATPGTPLPPIPLTVASAASEEYEGVLVTLTDVSAVVNPYACSADDAGCADAGLFMLNGSVVAWNRFYGGGSTEWTSEASTAGSSPTVTGVMHYRYNRRRICPRSAADIAP
jgi:imidazolonepropionase-like amidohydrolase